MCSLSLNIGDVFYWKNFPCARDGIDKNRYFLFLGKYTDSAYFVNCNLLTPTTKLRYYEDGGGRERNCYMRVNSGEYGLSQDSIFDVDQWLDPTQFETLNSRKDDIEIKGQFPDDKLKEIYSLIFRSKRVPPVTKKQIYRSFTEYGLTGLQRPRTRKRRRFLI